MERGSNDEAEPSEASQAASTTREKATEIYRAQRSHYTKMVETLYRSVPLYFAVVGALWAYAIKTSPENWAPSSIILIVAGFLSLLFGHTIGRYGHAMDQTMKSIQRFEGDLGVQHAQFFDQLPTATDTGYNLVNWSRNMLAKSRNIRSHNALAYAFAVAGVLSFSGAILLHIGTVISALVLSFLCILCLGLMIQWGEKRRLRGTRAMLDKVQAAFGESTTYQVVAPKVARVIIQRDSLPEHHEIQGFLYGIPAFKAGDTVEFFLSDNTEICIWKLEEGEWKLTQWLMPGTPSDEEFLKVDKPPQS